LVVRGDSHRGVITVTGYIRPVTVMIPSENITLRTVKPKLANTTLVGKPENITLRIVKPKMANTTPPGKSENITLGATKPKSKHQTLAGELENITLGFVMRKTPSAKCVASSSLGRVGDNRLATAAGRTERPAIHRSPGDSSQPFPAVVERGVPDDIIVWAEQLLAELRAGRVQLPPVDLKPGHTVLVPSGSWRATSPRRSSVSVRRSRTCGCSGERSSELVCGEGVSDDDLEAR
jgi:hypothetical protein